jgi:hypothetical protein
MEAGGHTRRVTVIWRLLAAFDVVLVTVFAVVAAIDPYHVLEGKGVEIHNFQGLLPTIVVVILRSVVLAADRYLLRVPLGAGLVLGSWLVSLIGFFYTGRWLAVQAYSRWQDVILGGTVGYALVGVAGIGLAVTGHALGQVRLAGSPGIEPPRQPQAGDSPPPGQSDDQSQEHARPQDGPTPPRRQLARDSLFGLVGVFLGITGLVMNVTNAARIAVAILVGGVAVAGIAYLLRRQSG